MPARKKELETQTTPGVAYAVGASLLVSFAVYVSMLI